MTVFAEKADGDFAVDGAERKLYLVAVRKFFRRRNNVFDLGYETEVLTEKRNDVFFFYAELLPQLVPIVCYASIIAPFCINCKSALFFCGERSLAAGSAVYRCRSVCFQQCSYLR